MGAKEPKRKARSIMASDSEWVRIGERARALDMPVSRYVVQKSLDTLATPQSLATEGPQQATLPVDLQWRLAHHLLVLARIERYRFERAGEGEAWQAIEEEAQALLDAEAQLDGKETER